jgi:hypothetical protein
VQPDHFGSLVFVEMTPDRVAYGVAQCVEPVGLGEDRVPKSGRDEAPSGASSTAKMISFGRSLMAAS